VKSIIVALLALAVSTQTLAQVPSEQTKKTLLREVLAQYEAQLAAAERDLLQAQKQLTSAKTSKTVRQAVSIIMTASGIAGLAICARYGIGTGVGKIALRPAASSTLLVGGGITLYTIAGSDIPKWEFAVEIRIRDVKKAQERVAELKAKLGA
jgi:hypothetical protein